MIDLIILASNISNCLIKIKVKIGEKSSPPAEGINFLIGSRSFKEISSIIFNIGCELLGATQLRTTPPITEKRKIVREVFKTSIIEIKARVYASYWDEYRI